ncbi:MAG TPA: alpha-1,4-glucan--maltose-1-phosphate maltosyltransferase [Bryobacteraceae bacterium]|nr:alpha-1,4-glucan--maltose-1-phosphate maltosyltransferase [Bryobacteraceae bacterium]
MHEDGCRRVVITGVEPEIEAGRFPIKRTEGERVCVEADVFADGHDAISCRALYRREEDALWSAAPMHFLANDRWRGEFTVDKLGRYRYTVEGWVDHFKSWRRDMEMRMAADTDADVDYLTGAMLVRAAAERSQDSDAALLTRWADGLAAEKDPALRRTIALDQALSQVMDRNPDRTRATRYGRELAVTVDPAIARFGAWYEFFPRSCSPEPGRHGTFADAEERLEYVARMGFDIVYLPPIHPIGCTHRKGRNNSVKAAPDDTGSPWAIGSAEGGHKSVHPALGTLDDFRRFAGRAREHGLQVALDLAFQCAPDHPYVTEHPEWFRRRPDGSVQYAENPPKKYQDIFPFDFETPDWRRLWDELLSVVLFWVEQGVRVFRVDNPHTKPLPMWEWLIGEAKRRYPDLIFLAEAFTRPKILYGLAKLGFTQSYNYFPWRNSKWELMEYFNELTKTEVREYCRPNLWPNTPDILTEYLQHGGRPAFLSRLILAATLGASYGIYGPPFELCENTPLKPGSEEYLNSEKYEIRHWELDQPGSLRDFITRVNRIRRENPALHGDWSLRFHDVDNDHLIAYTKHAATDGSRFGNLILTIVNLDPHRTHGGWLDLPLLELGIDTRRPYQVHELISDARYFWQGARNYVEVDPNTVPAQIFRIRRHIRSEREFEYFM